MVLQKKNNWWLVVKILLAIGLMFVIISRTDWNNLRSLFLNVPPFWLLLSLVLYFLSNMAKAFQYTVLLGRRSSYQKMLYIVTVQNTISNFLAAGAGITSLLASLKIDEGIEVSKSALAFLITKIMDVFFIGFFLGISSMFVWPKISVLRLPSVVLLVGIGILFIGFVVAVFSRQSFIRLMDRFLEVTKLRRFSFIQKTSNSFRLLGEQDQSYVLRLTLQSFGGSLLYFVVIMGLSFACYRIFFIPLGFWEIVFVTCLMQIISLIPVTVFGGLGVNEISFFFLFGLFGISPDGIPSFVVGIRVLSYFFILMALIYLPVYLINDRIKTRKHANI
jgi:glycosyltransferase 2 family protein